MTALARNDRHVVKARMQVAPSAPVQSLVFNVEEALRLCSLPGENEGRAYYFQHLSVRGLPENGDRRIWLDAFQTALSELARSAVHGRHAAARAADAVYFLSEQEACEVLMQSIVRRGTADNWFWSSISGGKPGATPAEHLVGIVKKLSHSEASWLAVASAMFSIPDPVSLLNVLPDHTVHQWLSELGCDAAPRFAAPPFQIAETIQKALTRSFAAFGPDDSRVVWLAALASILACPHSLENGTSVRSGRSILLRMQQSIPPMRQSERANREPARQPPGVLKISAAPAQTLDASAQDSLVTPADSKTAPQSDSEVNAPSTDDNLPEEARLARASVGENTEGAGLYFLLNAIPHVGLNSELTPPFLAHLFQRITGHAHLEPDDPILLWTQIILEENKPSDNDPRAVRIAVWKLRRWCWKNAAISLRDVVLRPGIVTLTRTHLDVSLALESVDLRIRRVGLDVDPGWLPWFGRVVRFHYVYRGELQ